MVKCETCVLPLQDVVYYAYFAPYPYERHEELIAEVSVHMPLLSALKSFDPAGRISNDRQAPKTHPSCNALKGQRRFPASHCADPE